MILKYEPSSEPLHISAKPSSASNDLVSPIWRDETATVGQKSTNPLEKVDFWRFGLVNRFSQPVSGRASKQLFLD